MYIDFSKTIRDLSGKEIVTSNEDPTPVSLGKICANSLVNLHPEKDKNTDGSEKFARWQLAKKVVDGGLVDLKVEEIAKIKERVGILCAPVVIGPVYEQLEKASDDR